MNPFFTCMLFTSEGKMSLWERGEGSGEAGCKCSDHGDSPKL